MPDISMMMKALSLTPRFSGAKNRRRASNRFSGFLSTVETAKAVPTVYRRTITRLKRDVNETTASKPGIAHKMLGLSGRDSATTVTIGPKHFC